MMRGRQLILSFSLLLICPAAAHATETASRSSTEPNESERLSSLEFDVGPDYHYAPETRWEDSVMMTSLPPGSLVVRYDGLQKVVIKHANSQIRRQARRYAKYSQGFQPKIDVWNDRAPLDSWWTRSWLASMSPEKGGAPAQPYVHTIGKEITWKYGPFTFSNMLRLKIDYLAVFRFNPDPGEKTTDEDPPPASIDVEPTKAATLGTKVRVKVRPSIRVGMPKSGSDGWLRTIRSVSVRAEIDVIIFGVRLIRGEILLKYEPGDEVVLRVGIEAPW